MPALSNVFIYSEPRCKALDFEEVASYTAEMLPDANVVLRGPLLESSIDGNGPIGTSIPDERLAVLLAGARVKSADSPLDGKQSILPGEIDYESRRLGNRESGVFGILYDAHFVADALNSLIPAGESGIDDLHIVFTNQLLGTWDPDDRRYHARAVLCGAPSLVSVSGMVEGPAKARGYYIARRNAEAFGLAEEEKMELARSFAEDCLSYDDSRLTEVSKGYVMQAAVYRITGKPFCNDPGCRLFNAHWQSELLQSQTGGDYEYCRGHRRLFSEFADRDGEVFWT